MDVDADSKEVLSVRDTIYSCKASITHAFSEILPTEIGLFWWRLLELLLQFIKDGLIPKHSARESEKKAVGQIGMSLAHAAKIWEGVDNLHVLKSNELRLKMLEIKIYQGIHVARASKKGVPLPNVDDDSVCLFWYRFFGKTLEPKTLKEFASALRLHLLFEHLETNGPIVSCDTFSKMLENVLEWDDGEGKITLKVWETLLARYGPLQKIFTRLKSVTVPEGKLAPWFMKDWRRTEAEHAVRQGAFRWILRLGRLSNDMTFVLTYKSEPSSLQHTPITKDSKGEYVIQGEKEHSFPSVAGLVADVCTRMEWYHSGYALKEERDRWLNYIAEVKKGLDRSSKANILALEQFFGTPIDPTCPTTSAQFDTKPKAVSSLHGTLLKWLDDNQAVNSLTEHLVRTLKPANTAAARKTLETLLNQIYLHTSKQDYQIRDYQKKLAKLSMRMKLLEGDTSATKHCTLQQLIDTEKKLHDASRILKAEIEAFYNRSLTFPNEFLCPLTHEVFKDPVITMDGHTYERKAITFWLRTHSTSPMTNMALSDKTLTPNISLRNSILAFKEKHKLVNRKEEKGS